jgi:hypothetical protein
VLGLSSPAFFSFALVIEADTCPFDGAQGRPALNALKAYERIALVRQSAANAQIYSSFILLSTQRTVETFIFRWSANWRRMFEPEL